MSGKKVKLKFKGEFTLEVDPGWYPEDMKTPQAILEWERNNLDEGVVIDNLATKGTLSVDLEN